MEESERRSFSKGLTESAVNHTQHEDGIDPAVLLPERIRIIQDEELRSVSNSIHGRLSDPFQCPQQLFRLARSQFATGDLLIWEIAAIKLIERVSRFHRSCSTVCLCESSNKIGISSVNVVACPSSLGISGGRAPITVCVEKCSTSRSRSMAGLVTTATASLK